MELVAREGGLGLRLGLRETACLGRGHDLLPGLGHPAISRTHLQCTAGDGVVQLVAGKQVTLQRQGCTST